MTQESLFAAQQARDEAIARVEANADQDWMIQATLVIELMSKVYDRFTTDDVWRELGRRDLTVREPRAIGAAMKKAKGKGVIAPTGNYVPSARPESHCRPIRVWRSVR
jgi:hypothetical protein